MAEHYDFFCDRPAFAAFNAELNQVARSQAFRFDEVGTMGEKLRMVTPDEKAIAFAMVVPLDKPTLAARRRQDDAAARTAAWGDAVGFLRGKRLLFLGRPEERYAAVITIKCLIRCF